MSATTSAVSARRLSPSSWKALATSPRVASDHDTQRLTKRTMSWWLQASTATERFSWSATIDETGASSASLSAREP